MLEERDLVLIGDVLPIGVVLPILAELMGVVALLLMGIEIYANAGTVIQRALIRQCFGGRSPLFDMEQTHLEALVQKLFLGLLLPLLFFACGLRFPPPVPSAGWAVLGVLALLPFGARVNPPPCCLKEETPCKSWDILGDGIIIDVFLHFAEELGRKLHHKGDILYVKLVIGHLNFIGVNQVLQKTMQDVEKTGGIVQ